MRRLAIAVIAASCLAAPGVASASRPATAAERDAIADELGVPGACAAVTMSTVDGAWALVKRERSAAGCEEALGGGFTVMHVAGGAWARFFMGSSVFGACPGVPRAVGRDLGICRVRRAYVLCANRGARARHRRFRPAACDTLGPRQPLAAAVNLARLHWKHWGDPTATARGVERGFHRPLTNIPVRVRAYRRRHGCRGDWVYTRLRVSSRHGHTIVRQSTGCP